MILTIAGIDIDADLTDAQAEHYIALMADYYESLPPRDRPAGWTEIRAALGGEEEAA